VITAIFDTNIKDQEKFKETLALIDGYMKRNEGNRSQVLIF